MHFGKNERGIILITTMLFLTILSMLAINIFDTSLLETKMSTYYHDKIDAFYKGENALEDFEQKVLAGEKIASAEIIDTSICGVIFYRITASTNFNSVKTVLRSTLAKIDKTAHCKQPPQIIEGRQSFLIEN